MIIIDNGHGRTTPGKCGPDGRLREWQWTRRAARLLAHRLAERGIDNTLLVPGDDDVGLARRCAMANDIARRHGSSVLLSLHTNAAGDGSRWCNASGWSAYVHPAASEGSRRLAALLFAEARARRLLGNRSTPPCGYWTANLAMLRRTSCPAVLTENMFHDNAADARYLLSEQGLAEIVDLHLQALLRWLIPPEKHENRASPGFRGISMPKDSLI